MVNMLAQYLLEDERVQVKEIVLRDIVQARAIYGFEDDSRVVRLKSDITRKEGLRNYLRTGLTLQLLLFMD